MGQYVYIQSEPRLWTVGFTDGGGKWQPDSDHGSREEAATRVHYLNGGGSARQDDTNAKEAPECGVLEWAGPVAIARDDVLSLAEILAQLVAVQAMRGANEVRMYERIDPLHSETDFEDAATHADIAVEEIRERAGKVEKEASDG